MKKKMIKDTTLILEREDLLPQNISLPIEEIKINHFNFLECFEEYRKNAIVFFVDKDLNYKILKNRYTK
jgi:hypothetical protein